MTMTPDEADPIAISLGDRRRRVDRRGIKLLLGITVILGAIAFAAVLVRPVAAAGVAAVWALLSGIVGVTWAKARQRAGGIQRTQLRPDRPLSGSLTMFQSQARPDLPIMSFTGTVRNRESQDFDVEISEGGLLVGIGILDRQLSSRGVGQVEIAVRLGNTVVSTDQGAWGAFLNTDLPTLGRCTIRVTCRGFRSITYLLECQQRPPESVARRHRGRLALPPAP